ncbi:MAG: GNAT family N-acetyltransferase [Omnitrophica WOR_2 bacterium]
MLSKIKLSVRPANEADRHKLANLFHFETHVHRHLDWRAPLDWIGYHPYLVAEQNNHILAALVCPPDPPEVAWIRLFAASSQSNISDAWETLWAAAQTELIDRPGIEYAAIPLQHWFRSLLEKSGYYHANNVVLLLWQHGNSMPKSNHALPPIRPMNFDDLPSVAAVDASAFEPIWQNSLDSLELAFRQAAVATVAEDEEAIVGYQISTASPMGGHLARLAVQPRMQGQGIGYALVRDMLDQFERRGALRVSVNTQEDNVASSTIYEKAGFRRTGENYPVYQYPRHPILSPASGQSTSIMGKSEQMLSD